MNAELFVFPCRCGFTAVTKTAIRACNALSDHLDHMLLIGQFQRCGEVVSRPQSREPNRKVA
jgi:hypothetical protein